jgi:hypothetical protein
MVTKGAGLSLFGNFIPVIIFGYHFSNSSVVRCLEVLQSRVLGLNKHTETHQIDRQHDLSLMNISFLENWLILRDASGYSPKSPCRVPWREAY